MPCSPACGSTCRTRCSLRSWGFLFSAVTGTFLVITDVVMPKMSGRELVESLRAMKGDLKFMYTSGYTNDTIVQHDILRSGTVLVEKPIDSEILLGRIREVLDSGKK
jgi:CheY-like chemotaxis protein